MKVLVTGSSGFIGYHLVKSLLMRNHEVIGIDNHNDYYDVSLKKLRKNSLDSSKFKFYLQDLNNISLDDDDFDLAINLAAQAGVRVSKKNESLYEHSNIQGFQAFCKFCQEKGIDKIVYASSSSVYCDKGREKFKENITDLNPKSKYGLSKLANELYASEFSKISNISFVGLRFFSVYGPLGRPDMAYYLFTDFLKKGLKIPLINGGQMARDMTYIDDVIQGILGGIDFILSEKNKIKNEIFNLGNDSPITTTKLLYTIENKLKIKSKIQHISSKNESKITHADITKSKNLLGYYPKICFEDGIERFLNWHNNI